MATALPPAKKARVDIGYGIGAAAQLRKLLAETGDEMLMMPCCGDALTAKLIVEADFKLTFLSGFSLSALSGHPDAGLVSYGEVLSAAEKVVEALRNRIPLICDADTGYENPMNVRRTVRGLAQVGCAGILLEDQENPKRCGHTKGKTVVAMEQAEARIRAAVDAREDMRTAGTGDIFILARTDARATHGLDEAIRRCKRFIELGVDMTFLEAPLSKEEMRRYCAEVPGLKMANIVDGGSTPVLPPKELQDIGFKAALYPAHLLAAGIKAQQEVLKRLKSGDMEATKEMLMPFSDVKRVVGFEDYYKDEEKYRY